MHTLKSPVQLPIEDIVNNVYVPTMRISSDVGAAIDAYIDSLGIES